MSHLKYDGGMGNLKNRLIRENSFDSRSLGKYEVIFAQGNGYVGVKNILEESYPGEVRSASVAGTFNKASAEEVTELPNVPDIAGITILIGGHVFNLMQGELSAYARTMNLRNGETVRKVRWRSPDGAYTVAVFKRIVSLADEHVIATAPDLMVDKGVQIVIETGVDGTVTNSGAQYFKDLKRRIYDGGDMQYLSGTTESDVQVAQHTACSLDLQADILPVMERRTLENRYTFMAKAGQNIYFERISATHTFGDLEYEDAKTEGIEKKLVADNLKSLYENDFKGYQGLKGASALQWEKYWRKNGITIGGGTDFEQLTVRFSLYHLSIMTEQGDNRIGIGARALAGEGYKGHSFWGTELFILPYFTFTRPGAAKSLLEYRYKNSVGARRKAKENGYKGTMYPWECAWVGGGEVTPLYKGADVITGKVRKVLAGLIEYHISADIAYAVWQYYLMTGDRDLMETCGYEMILDTALFWASRVQYRKETGRYETLDTIGPDEYREHVDNSAYTSYMANYNMHLVLFIMENLLNDNAESSERLDHKLNLFYIKEKIDSCIDRLYLPGPGGDDIIPQADEYLHLTKIDITKYKNSEEAKIIYKGFNTKQIDGFMISKQTDTAMLIFLFPDLFDEEIRRKSLTFCEDKTPRDSSLSRCIHSIMANDLGLTKMAYDFYKRSLIVDLGSQMKSSNEGIHSAAIGGTWENAVMGFGGVRLKGEYLHIAPKLPRKQKKLISPLCLKGCQLKITAAHRELVVKNMKQQKSSCILNGELVSVEPETAKRMELQRSRSTRYQGITSDLDGVICHTDKYHYQAWKKLADRLGIYFDETINSRLRGVNRMESLDIILEKDNSGLTEKEEAGYTEEKSQYYRGILEEMNPDDLSDEVKDTLNQLREQGYRMAIGSSSENAGFILERTGPKGFFDAVSDGNNIINSKPDPEIFLKATQFLGLDPKDCLVVEDARAGLLAAVNGNMGCAAIGGTVNSELANYRLNTFRDLLNIS